MAAPSDLSERRDVTGVAVLESAEVREIIRRALAEDGVFNDITTDTLIAPEQSGTGVLLAKEAGVVAGIPVAAAVFAEIDPDVSLTPLVVEGSRVQPGVELAHLRGRYSSMLRAERVALNLLQRMSGVATMAAHAVELVSGLPVRVVDTRKTTPGLRPLEKYAVRTGGAHNHRYNLADGILIKDNHLAALRAREQGIADAVRLARAAAPHTIRIEIEVTTLEEVDDALEAAADIILLDNMTLDDMRIAADRCQGHALSEASGGITLANLRAVAETGVDIISLGALTHSAKALDISLELATD
ncbi:MAG: carboxylating nicotinate-nucleotide diphosphorylase [Dehalococcoidia bacterium]